MTSSVPGPEKTIGILRASEKDLKNLLPQWLNFKLFFWLVFPLKMTKKPKSLFVFTREIEELRKRGPRDPSIASKKVGTAGVFFNRLAIPSQKVRSWIPREEKS